VRLFKRYGLLLTVIVIAAGVFFLMKNQKESVADNSSAEADSSVAASQNKTTDAPADATKTAAAKKEDTARVPSQETTMGGRAFSGPLPAKKAMNKGPGEHDALVDTALFPESRWKRWPGVRALAPNMPVASSEVLAEISGYKLTHDENFVGDEKAFSQEDPLVYYDARTRSAGVVTGELRLVVKDKAKLDQLLDLYRLKVSTASPNLSTYFVTSIDPNFNLEELYSKLSRESQVESVQVEIQSRQYEKF
jgi:hypothetical protein